MSATPRFFPSDFDLRSVADARAWCKQEVVSVRFASEPGALQSREGLNHFAAGDALITADTGDQWSVSRQRFDNRYLPVAGTVPGQDGQYQNQPIPVLALQQTEAFNVERSAGGDVIHGQPGDWLMQYAPGDHGIVENAKFQRVYRALR